MLSTIHRIWFFVSDDHWNTIVNDDPYNYTPMILAACSYGPWYIIVTNPNDTACCLRNDAAPRLTRCMPAIQQWFWQARPGPHGYSHPCLVKLATVPHSKYMGFTCDEMRWLVGRLQWIRSITYLWCEWWMMTNDLLNRSGYANRWMMGSNGQECLTRVNDWGWNWLAVVGHFQQWLTTKH